MPVKGSKTGVIKVCICGSRFYCVPSELNPLRRDGVRKYCSHACRYLDEEFKRKTKDSILDAWTPERKKAWALFMRSPAGRKIQKKAQKNGNKKRKGKASLAHKTWWKKASEVVKKARAEKISRKVSDYIKKNGAGWGNKGFVKGKQGWLLTKFGLIRFDSSWEKEFLLHANSHVDVISITRDVPVLYVLDGVQRRFLVDFCVKFKKRKPLLVEIKCPYFLDTPSTKTKVRAARIYAYSNGMDFCLLASLAQVRGKLK